MRLAIRWAACLLFFSFRALAGTLPLLPQPVNIGQDAGCYSLLIVTLHLQDGKELPFVVDTGCPVTAFDTSLTPELGKRLDTDTVSMEGGSQPCGVYRAPRLFLGDTPLWTGSNVWTCDFSWLSSLLGRRFMGILGVDCLSNYCVQLDFQTGTMRFLDPARLDVASLGKVYPLGWSAVPGDATFPSIRHPGLLGGPNGVIYIDVGDDSDGQVKKGMIKGHHFMRAVNFLTTAILGVPTRVPVNQCVWDGETYTDIGVVPGKINRFGLSFLARHIVTFDFPGQKLYLKQISTGPREPKLFVNLRGQIRAAAQPLLLLEGNGQLPGWSRDDTGTVDFASRTSFSPGFCNAKEGPYLKVLSGAALKSVTVNFKKEGDSTIYHYTVSRSSPDSDWEFQKAWQADASGKTIREYSVQ